jgi:hypothetical protein
MKKLTHLLTILSLLFVLIPRPAEAQSCTPVPTSIDATGQTDVTIPLQTFVDSVPDGGCITFPTTPGGAGRYLVNGKPGPWGSHEKVWSLRLLNRDLDIFGNRATLFVNRDGPPYPGGREMLRIDGGDINVQNLNITGFHPGPTDPGTGALPNCAYELAHEFDHGVAIYGNPTRVLLNGQSNSGRARIGNHKGDLVFSRDATNVSITNYTLDCAGRQGIAATPNNLLDGLTITGNTIDHIARWVMDIEPDLGTGTTRNVLVSGNTVGRSGIGFLSGNNPGREENFTIRFNTFTVAQDPMNLLFGNVHGLTVEDNVGVGTVSNVLRIHTNQGFSTSSNIDVNRNTQAHSGVALNFPVPNFQEAGCGPSGCWEDHWNCGVTDSFASDNTFLGASSLYTPASAEAYAACGWVDGGGNVL